MNAKKARHNQKELWIIGDIYLNWRHYFQETKDKDDLIEKVKEFMIEENMSQLVEETTRRRIVNNFVQESIIDPIYTSHPTKLGTMKIKEVSSSDHAFIYFSRTLNENIKMQHIFLRNYKNLNEELFLADLKKMD